MLNISKLVRSYSRRNGWNSPSHPLQIMAWIIVLYLAASTFGVLAPSVAPFWIRMIIYLALAALVLVNVVANIVVTTIDPSDDAVRKKIRNNPRPMFDRSKHHHVIDENYFCNICEAFIHPSSKHCRQCNKCVFNFDHHCKWLNNCIGGKNYKWFLFYIASTEAAAFCIFALSLTLFILQFVDRDVLFQEKGALLIFGQQVPESVWLSFVGLSAVVSAVVVILLLHLLIFHLRIVVKGTTTYNYITEQKKKDEEKEKRKTDLSLKAGTSSRLFSRSLPVNGMANGGTSNAKHRKEDTKTHRRYSKLRNLLKLRLKRNESTGHRNGSAVPEISLKPPIGNVIKEDLKVTNASGESVKMEKKEEAEMNCGNDANGSLPPIQQMSIGSRVMAISNFIQIGVNSDPSEGRKRRTESVQRGRTCELMEDQENRISVSQIAAALPMENVNRAENRATPDSAALNGYSRHAVPRLPPLPMGASGQNGKPSLNENATKPPRSFPFALLNDLTSSLASTASTDNLREIPVASFSKPGQQTTFVTSSAQRSSSGSSTTSSGSTLAPLQVDTLSSSLLQGSSNASVGSRHFGRFVQDQHRLRLLSTRGNDHHLATLTDDCDSRVSQISDNASLSSGSKRVRFDARTVSRE